MTTAMIFLSATWVGAMAGYTFCDGAITRPMLRGAAFGAWHGLFIYAGWSIAKWVAP